MTNSKEDGAQNKAVDLDSILVEEIGQFGPFQIKSLLIYLFIEVVAGFQPQYIFTAARINSRCLIPECEGTSSQEFAPSWLLNAVPVSSDQVFESCQRYNISGVGTLNGTCPDHVFDRETIVPCDANVYENQNTVVYDFDLGCDEWRRTLIGSLRTVGSLFSLPLTGFISDKWGRRTALAINGFMTGWLGVTRYWANTYIGFVATQFAEAMFSGAMTSCVYILMLEFTGPKYRVLVGGIVTPFFSVGQCLMGALAWAVPYWRHLTLILYAPQILILSYIWITSESVRWYLSKGRYKDAEKVLKKVARLNGKTLSEKSLSALKATAEEEKSKGLANDPNETWLILLVFRYKPILLRCIVGPIIWISFTFVYYGLVVNSVDMVGNSYVNYIVTSAAEIPGSIAAIFFLTWFGRKPVLTGSFWVCAACMIAYIFLGESTYAVALTLYVVGKFSISITVTVLYVYTIEMFPTKYRHRLMAFCSMMGRIGSIMAPLTPALGKTLPYILFGSLSIISGALVFFMPETRNTVLPDTMEEAVHFGTPTPRSDSEHTSCKSYNK